MAEYIKAFDENSSVGKLYQALKKKGVKDPDIDQGFEEVDYVRYARSPKSRHDKVIRSEEVLNYVFEKLGLSPEEIAKVTDYADPLGLDDPKGKYPLAKEIKAKLKGHIAFFRAELKRAGYRETEDKFQELLAVSVFTFVLTSKKGEKDFLAPEGVFDELRKAKAGVIAESIMREGGLGLANYEKDCDPEATALEALTKKCGMCTEFTYILYAAFKLAGLAVAGLDVKAPPKYLEQKGLPPNAQHTALVLKLKKGFRIFDSDKGRSDASNHFRENKFIWVQVSEREMISMYYANLAFNICRGSGQADCLDAHKKAQELNPGHYRINMNLGVYYGKNGQLEKAVELLKKAQAQNPKDTDIHSNLVSAYRKLANSNLNRDNAKALVYCRQLVDLEPKNNSARLILAQLFAQLGRHDEANAEYRTLLKNDPTDRSVILSYARLLANQGRALIKGQKYAAAAAKLREARQTINIATKQRQDEEAKEIIDYIEALQKLVPTNLPK